MKTFETYTAGLPQLDIHTLDEVWALGTGLELHWRLLGESVGLPPSKWIDTQGDRMYGAVIALWTEFDLQDPLKEDDVFAAECEITAVRKPHALSVTQFRVEGRKVGQVRLLTSFIKRRVKGSNKRFSKTRDLWTADDVNPDMIETLLEEHHAKQRTPNCGEVVHCHEVNRAVDFNTADFMYFRNYVKLSKAAEWIENRGNPTRLNATRACYFFGNVDDGEVVRSAVTRHQDEVRTEHLDAKGKRIFLSEVSAPIVEIAER